MRGNKEKGKKNRCMVTIYFIHPWVPFKIYYHHNYVLPVDELDPVLDPADLRLDVGHLNHRLYAHLEAPLKNS